MFVTILKANGKPYTEGEDLKEVRKGIYIPDFFKDEAQYDRWFDTVFKEFRYYHHRKNNTPEIMNFEGLELELKFT